MCALSGKYFDAQSDQQGLNEEKNNCWMELSIRLIKLLVFFVDIPGPFQLQAAAG